MTVDSDLSCRACGRRMVVDLGPDEDHPTRPGTVTAGYGCPSCSATQPRHRPLDAAEVRRRIRLLRSPEKP